MKIHALGLTSISSDGDLLDVYFPYIEFGKDHQVGDKNAILGSVNKNLIEVLTSQIMHLYLHRFSQSTLMLF